MTDSKRTLNQSSNDRLTYEMNVLATKEARLATLKVGSKAYLRCVESIKKTGQLIIKIEAQMVARQEKAAARLARAAVVANDVAPAVSEQSAA